MSDYTDEFEAFWSVYPRRISKSTAAKSFAKLTPEEQNLARIDVEKRTRRKWWSSDPKKIAHASTYLNQRRWEDEWEGDLVARSEAGLEAPARAYHPAPELPQMTKWKALANRLGLKWLRTVGGLSFDTEAENKMLMASFTEELNAVVKDGEQYLDQDEDQREAVMTFAELLLSRLDKRFGKNVTERMLRSAKAQGQRATA